MNRIAIPAEIRVLVVASFLIAVGFGLVAPVLPSYAQSFNVGVAAATLTVSAFAFFRLAFAPAGGALVARLGERSIYVAGLIVVAVSSLATAFAQSYVQLLIVRGLGGVGSTMFTVSAAALVVRLAPTAIRARCSAAYATSFLFGNMLGPVLGGGLAEFGLRVPFVVYAVFLFGAAAVVTIRLRDTRLRAAPGTSQRPAMLVREALVHRTFRAAMLSGFANGWCNFGTRVAVVPLLAVSVHDATWVAGAALALASVGTAGALQLSGRWADSVGRRPVMLIGLAVSGLGIGVMGLSASLLMLLALSVFSGIGAGLMGPAQQASLADLVGTDRNGGKVLATFQMSQDAGTIIGPVTVGAIADAVGFDWAFALAGAVALVAMLPWLRAPETLALARSSSAS